MKKTLHFDKYMPYTLVRAEDGVQKEMRLKLASLFNALASSPTGKSLREVYGEKYRLQICKFHSSSNIWELQILHLRNSILPGIADEEEDFELMVLPEGRYPTESSTILYSPNDDILYFQRNIACMSAKRMEAYLRAFLPDGVKILLKPVLAGERIGRITDKASYRKIVLACGVDRRRKYDQSNCLERMLHEYAQYQGLVANITIGMGRKKGRLNSAAASELIRAAYSENDTHSLKVHIDPDGSTNFEWVDLMLDREVVSISLEYSKDNPITHTRLFTACHEAIISERRG